MPADHSFEDDLIHAISRTGDGFHTETGPLIEIGAARGRDRRRRRTAAAVAGGVASLALVGAGGVYASGVRAPDRSTGIPVAAAPTTTTTSAPVVTADEVAATFKVLLPAGRVSDVRAKGVGGAGDFRDGASVEALYDDGHGAARLIVLVSRAPAGMTAPGDCPDAKLVRHDGCTTRKLEDGSTLRVYQGYEYSDGRSDVRDWSAVLIGADGRKVELEEWNAEQEKDAPVTRPAPPLDPAQLAAMVADPSWARIAAAVPVPARPSRR